MSAVVRSMPPVLPQPRLLGPVRPRVDRPTSAILTVIAHRVSPRTTVLTARGEVDMSSAPLLRARLEEHIGDLGPDLVADLAGVSFLSAAGLAVLAAARDAASRAEIRFSVVACTRAVLRPLTITGLLAVLDVYPDLAPTLTAAAPSPRRAPIR